MVIVNDIETKSIWTWKALSLGACGVPLHALWRVWPGGKHHDGAILSASCIRAPASGLRVGPAALTSLRLTAQLRLPMTSGALDAATLFPEMCTCHWFLSVFPFRKRASRLCFFPRGSWWSCRRQPAFFFVLNGFLIASTQNFLVKCPRWPLMTMYHNIKYIYKNTLSSV